MYKCPTHRARSFFFFLLIVLKLQHTGDDTNVQSLGCRGAIRGLWRGAVSTGAIALRPTCPPSVRDVASPIARGTLRQETGWVFPNRKEDVALLDHEIPQIGVSDDRVGGITIPSFDGAFEVVRDADNPSAATWLFSAN